MYCTVLLMSRLIVITEKFYELKKQQARDAVSLYRKFVVKMDRINDFMKVARVRCRKLVM